MGTAPILLAWGDDLLLIEQAVGALGARVAAGFSTPPRDEERLIRFAAEVVPRLKKD